MLVVAVIVVGGTPVTARAALGFDHGGTGNGRNNRNNISVNSPTINRGVQHVNNTNIDGNTITQAAFCKGRFRHCRFNQRAITDW